MGDLTGEQLYRRHRRRSSVTGAAAAAAAADGKAGADDESTTGGNPHATLSFEVVSPARVRQDADGGQKHKRNAGNSNAGGGSGSGAGDVVCLYFGSDDSAGYHRLLAHSLCKFHFLTSHSMATTPPLHHSARRTPQQH
jgi:hypothetical protein